MAVSSSLAGPSSQQVSEISRLADSAEFQLDREDVEAVMEAAELQLYEDNVDAAMIDE